MTADAQNTNRPEAVTPEAGLDTPPHAKAPEKPGHRQQDSFERRSAPTGPIRSPAPWGGFGVHWEQINRWDDAIRAAAAESGVPFERIKAHIVIESQGVPTAVQQNDENGWSFGLMQVVPRYWSRLILDLAGAAGAGLNERDERAVGQLLLRDGTLAIRVGAGVLRAFFRGVNDWDKASSQFFTGSPDWSGSDWRSGTEAAEYRDALRGLMAEIGASPGGATADEPAPPPMPPPPAPTPPTPTPTRLSRVKLPSGVTEADLRRWFGDAFNPNGEVTVLWAEEGARTGRFPRLERFDPPGAVRYFEFAGGLKIRSDEGGVRVARVAD